MNSKTHRNGRKTTCFNKHPKQLYSSNLLNTIVHANSVPDGYKSILFNTNNHSKHSCSLPIKPNFKRQLQQIAIALILDCSQATTDNEGNESQM